MTSFIAKYISKKILGESLQNNFGTEDPYFETVPATRLDGRPTKKTTKRKKALPMGISEHDAKVLTKVKRRAYRLDMSLFNCCGIRFGWSSVIGIIPLIGDVIDGFMAMMVLRTAQQVEGGLPSNIQAKMMFNICLDFGVGLIPFLGDVADALFRANTRNAVVLEKHLRAKGATALKNAGIATPPLDPTDPDEYDRQLREELGAPPTYNNATPDRHGTQAQQGNVNVLSTPHNDRVETTPAQPTQPNNVAAKQGSGWFSGGGSKKKQHDVERGSDLSGNASTIRKDRPSGV